MVDVELKAIHNQQVEIRSRAALAQDTIELSKRAEREFIDTNCPACLSPRRSLAYTIHGMCHQRCEDCRTLYISPCPTDAHILEFLENSEGLRIWREEMPAETRLSRKPMYRKRLDAALDAADRAGIPPRVVIEVGGGNGEFAEEAVLRGAFERLIIAEPQPLDLNLPGVEVVCGSFDDIEIAGKADVILAFEVFEHLVEPDRFLAFARRNLRAGGLLFMTTPNVDGFEPATMGAKSYTIPFDHVRLYNPQALRKVLNRNGFEVLNIETPGELDVQIVQRAYESGSLDLSENPALKYILEAGAGEHGAFQEYLRRNLLSGHMRCAATPG